MVKPETFDAFAAICSENSDLKHDAGMLVLCRLYRTASADQILAALRGDEDVSVGPGERRGHIEQATNALMRGSLDLDAMVDEAMRDQKFSRAERVKIRRAAKAVIEKACGVAAHVNEPATV